MHAYSIIFTGLGIDTNVTSAGKYSGRCVDDSHGFSSRCPAPPRDVRRSPLFSIQPGFLLRSTSIFIRSSGFDSDVTGMDTVGP